MIYKIVKIKQAEKEISNLTKNQQDSLINDYNIIETKGIEYVKRRYLRDGLF